MGLTCFFNYRTNRGGVGILVVVFVVLLIRTHLLINLNQEEGGKGMGRFIFQLINIY